MRFVVYGAGAVGGVIGGRLSQHGHDVVLIARGEHGRAIRERGLVLRSPDDERIVRAEVVGHPREVAFSGGEVVLLTMKGQDTAAALADLAACAPPETSVVVAQNGVEGERLALRRFPDVLSVVVMCPAAHLRPGEVAVSSAPVSGILDVGRYPHGVDELTEAVAQAFNDSTFASETRPDVMRWKYRKLLTNLGNAVEALCGPQARRGRSGELAEQEGLACLDAAGIAVASRQEDAERRGDLLELRPVAGQARQGGSSWQSLARGTGTIETDTLNGEIVLLGRLHGVPTPVNALLQRLAGEAARRHEPPGRITEGELLSLLP